MSHVQEINDIRDLAGLRLRWRALLDQTPNATFFHSLDWLETYWRHSGKGQRLRVLVVSSGGRPIGILPLVVRTEATRVGPIRVLTYPLHDWGSFYGPIGPNPTATLLAGLRHIRNCRRDFDLIDLRWIDGDGHDRGRTQNALSLAGFDSKEGVWGETALVAIEGEWGDYWNARDTKWRSELARCRRRLNERGEVTHVRYRPDGEVHGDGDPRWDLFDACLEVARQSWQGSSTTGTTLCHDEVLPYFRDAHAQAARTGSLDLNLLMLDSRPIAFAYNYHHSGSVYGLRRGFDPDLASTGPGHVLQWMILEDSFGRGDHLYDLGAGYLETKKRWTTSLATMGRVTHYPIGTPRAQLLRLKRWLTDRYRPSSPSGTKRTATATR